MEVEENILEEKIVCNKGNMILKINKNKLYNLSFDLKNLNIEKVNINSLLSPEIYNLIQETTKELIEKIYILNSINENETDICILIKSIAKEVGIKAKYMIFRTIRNINLEDDNIEFENKDLSKIDINLLEKYKKEINLDLNKYEPMIFEYGKTYINKITNNVNLTSLIDINFSIDFIISIKDYLPIYMENIIGLMFKKIFYNLKVFIDKLNN